MSRTFTASDRKRLIRLASTMPIGSPARYAFLVGLAKAPVAHRTRKNARAKLNGFEKSHIKAMRDTLDRVERLVAKVTLNDASDAFSDMEKVSDVVSLFEGGGYTESGNLHFWNNIPDDIEDGADDLQQAVEAARDEIQYMIDAGMADDGYEDAVMEKMENEVMPQVDDAIVDFAYILKGFR